MRKVSSVGKKKRGASKARVPRRVPNVREPKAKRPRTARGPAEGSHTPVFFEAGYWWPDEQVPTKELAPAPGPGLAKAGFGGVQHGRLHSAAIRGGVSIPILGLKTLSEQNLREHWRTRAARAKHQKETVGLVLHASVAHMMMAVAPLVVTMTRVSPGPGLDSDNMVGSQKHVRDAIAKVLGIDDKDERVDWRVQQKKGPWAVEIHIASAGKGA